MLSNLLLPLMLNVASAGDGGEISFNWGQLGAHDDSWELFSDNDQLRTVGLRLGYGINQHLSVVGGWQHAFDGGSLWVESEDDFDEGELRLSLATNRFAVGPKARLEIFPWLVPYATVQGTMLWGAAKFDDDPGDDENLNQIRASGLAFGGVGALGVELVARPEDKLLRPAFGFEAGYGWLSPLELDQLGQLDFRGFYGSWTLGLRF